MLTINIPITLYKFDELSSKSKSRAIEYFRCLLLEDVMDNWRFESEEDRANSYDDILCNDEFIIDYIVDNDYYFFDNGKLAHTTYYTKTGREDFHFMNKAYCIKE